MTQGSELIRPKEEMRVLVKIIRNQWKKEGDVGKQKKIFIYKDEEKGIVYRNVKGQEIQAGVDHK